MAAVDAQIIVRIKALLEGLPQVQALNQTLRDLKNARIGTATDGDMARIGRAAVKLREQLVALELEFSRLQKQTALGPGFASPEEFARLKELGSVIAAGKRQEAALDQANHLAAAENIRKRREAIIQANEAEKTEAAKVEAADAADFNKRIAERVAKRKVEQAGILAAQEEQQRKVQGTLQSIEGFSKGLATGIFAPLKAVGSFVAGVFAQIVQQVQFLIASFALFAASSPALAFGLLIKEGIEFNSIMEQQQIGLAALIQSTNDIFRKDQPNKPLEGIEAYEAATKIAAASTDRLSIKLIPLRATLEDLLPIFNQIVTAGAAAGLTLQQTENVFVDLAAAAQVVNIPLDKLATGIRLLLNGTARATTVLATALFGSAQAANSWVKEHKKMGDLADALHTKLEAFSIALITSESSFATLAQNTKDVFQRLAGIATSGLFDKLKQSLVEILKSFYDLKELNIKPAFQGLFDFIRDELTKAGGFILNLTEKVIGYLTSIASYVAKNRDYVDLIIQDLIGIGEQLGLIIVELGKAVSDTFLAAKGTLTWHEFLEIVERRIGSIHDALNVVIGAFQFLGGTIISALILPLEGVLDILGLISQRAYDAATKLQQARLASEREADTGEKRFFSGINEDGRNAVIADQNARKATQETTVDFGNSEDIALHNLTTKLKAGATATSKPKGGRHGGSHDNQLADSLKDLRDSLLDKNLTALEARVNKVLFLFDRAKEILDRQLADHLVSITDYYNKVLEVEQNSIDAQSVAEEAKAKRDRETSASKIQALQEKASNASNPKEREAFLNQVLTERNKLASKEIEHSEKLDELAGKRKAKEFEIADARDKALRALEADTREIQASRLEEQDRPADAANLRIAGEFKDKLQEFLINFDSQLGPAINGLITDIEALGGVSSEQFRRMLENGGIAFSSLSKETQDLIEHMQHLEQAAKLAAVAAKFDRTSREQQIEVNRIQEDLNRGKLTQIEYEQQINALNDKNFQILEDQLAQQYLLAQSEEDRLKIKEKLEDLKNAHKEINSLAQDINGAIRNDVTNLFQSLIQDPAHAAAAFKKMALSMAQDIAFVLVKALVLDRLFKALNILPGSTGGLGGVLSGGHGGVLSGGHGGGIGFAEGGVVSGPGTGTSDSIVARISNGEAVIPANVVSLNRGLINSLVSGNFASGFMPRFATGFAPAGGGNGGFASAPPKVVVALDNETIANEMMSSAGEKVWLHHFKKNRRGLGL